jgi:hypothetical protein
MKKGGYFLSIIIVLMIGTMAFTSKNVEVKGDWSEWQITECAKGLDYRVKKGSYDMTRRARKWHVQFKSRYSLTIHYNYKAVSIKRKKDVRKIRTNNPRLHLEANKESREFLMYVKANKEIYMHIDKIRFGKMDKGKNFYPCNKKAVNK